MTRLARPSSPFEQEECSRCGGSGSYSWCPQWGSTCFKCGGRGWTLTKKGAAAQAYYLEKMSVPASALVPGDQVRVQVFTIRGAGGERWEKVVSNDPHAEVLVTEYAEVELTTHQSYGGATFRRKWYTAADRDAAIADALAYQARLTKAGTPRKRG